MWWDICKDIWEGIVNECVSDFEFCLSVLKVLLLNLEFVDLIECECVKGWFGIIEWLFFNINYIMSIFLGFMLFYVVFM